MDKKTNMFVDAIILCVITLILGAVLAGVYMVTKEPIEKSIELFKNRLKMVEEIIKKEEKYGKK